MKFRIHITTFLLLLAGVLYLSAPEASAADIFTAQGRASWYGTTAHGKQTANGEIYNRHALTAAHKGLPFGTVVRVHNLRNGRNVLVRVNDRGPFVKGRIVDVSLKAAELLGMTKSGVVPVRLEVVGTKKGTPLNAANAFYVRLGQEKGALKARGKAMELQGKLKCQVKLLYSSAGVSPEFLLCIGPFDRFKEAHAQFMKLGSLDLRGVKIIEAPADGQNSFTIPDSVFGIAGPDLRTLWGEHGRMLRLAAAVCHPALYAVSVLAIDNTVFLLADL